MTVKYDTRHHAGADANDRIASRLRHSGAGAKPDHTATHGTGPTRTHTNTFDRGQGAGLGRGPRAGDKS